MSLCRRPWQWLVAPTASVIMRSVLREVFHKLRCQSQLQPLAPENFTVTSEPMLLRTTCSIRTGYSHRSVIVWGHIQGISRGFKTFDHIPSVSFAQA